MKMKKVLALLLVLVLAFSLAACGGDEKKDAEKKDGDSKEAAGDLAKAGVMIYKFDDNFMSFVKTSLIKNAEGKLDMSLVDSQNDQAKQNEQIETFLSKGVNVLAVNIVTPESAGTVIEMAKKKDVPVIFFNREPEKSALEEYDKAVYVGTKSEESGIIQGQMILDAWKANKEWDRNGDGVMQYVLLKGEPGHPDAEARTTFAVSTVEDGGVKVEELELQTGMWDTQKAKDIMDAWISKHGDKIEMVIANNDAMALGAVTSLEGAGYLTGEKFMPVVGVDAIPDALTKIEEGKMVGTVLNDAGGQGKATIEIAMNLAAGKDPLEGTDWKYEEGTKAVRVPYQAITKENLDVAKESYGE